MPEEGDHLERKEFGWCARTGRFCHGFDLFGEGYKSEFSIFGAGVTSFFKVRRREEGQREGEGGA